MSIKPGHNDVCPYILTGDAAKLAKFLTAVFGATEVMRWSRPDGTGTHLTLRIGDSVVMLGERTGSAGLEASTHVYVADVDACFRLALENGGRQLSEPRDMPYGDRSCGVEDPLGNTWWIGSPLAR
ncbi:MAG TPA: VOC family protein [Polyangiales bacterium]|nr:VOC family protein [Polyangiales bacterium]